jgi:hypothetical protein
VIASCHTMSRANRLNISVENCSFARSPNLKVFRNRRSKSLKAVLRKEFLGNGLPGAW